MTADILIKFGPMLGGAVLLLICALNIFRNPTISNAQIILMLFGALLFAIPTLTNFNLKGAGFELSGQTALGQVTTQGAEIKQELTQIRQGIEALAKSSAPASAAVTAAANDAAKNKGSLVFIIYSQGQKSLAQAIENTLLRKGFSANSVFTDYTELDDSLKGQPGQARFVYTEATKPIANTLKTELNSVLPSARLLPDRVVPRISGSADVQIQLF